MPQNNNILQELRDLESSLGYHPGNPYEVPAGYFDGLPGLVLSRIKTLQALTVSEELELLSPFLNTLSRDMPFKVPAGYFENLEQPAKTPGSVAEELDTLSPLLGNLKKQMPYEVPAGYFENLSAPKQTVPINEPAKIISLGARKWFRFAAAAMITGVIAMAAFMIFGKKELEARSMVRFEKNLKKEIKNMSDQELDEFIQYTDAGLNGEEKASVNTPDELKDVLKDVPESEIKEFLEETADLETAPSGMN